ncbi:tRNA (guanosine(46)-N7)-methyltransferase TrmB [Campylobacter sp. 7477a]|uniref:tRNA (guanosine(46)-N7)-methyltransferase TrmB n=1 Tax=Campylobacter sp. 7477a TaxID=2735741 RepID=UPI0030146B60|nr:tRNA (guanosine(46)-N7)-methyltransferase TrmB [Campylobacter sp. 7477a]
MPNFIAKNLENKPYPFGKDDVEFLWEACGRTEKLIYTKSGDEDFFIITKKQGSGENFVIKGEKLTKPSRVGLLQKALCIYRDENTSEVLSEAFAVKNNRLTQKTSFIADIKEFLEEFNELKEKFPKIFIEIGFGSGRHLLFQAQNNQNALVVGIEVYKPSIEQVAKLAKVKNLDNIRLINTDARLLLSLVGSNLVDKIFLHFPVPWDKAEHRRVVSKSFAIECERVLKSGGNFELRTDSREYCDFSIMHFLNFKDSELSIYKNRNLQISSKYEDRWKMQQKDIYDVIYTCKNDSEQEKLDDRMDFTGGYDVKNLTKNFKNETFKFDDFFIHFEEIYTIDDNEILLKVAFGAFNKPEQCFVKVNENECEYFIKKPLLTRENLKAHNVLKEYLANAANYQRS